MCSVNGIILSEILNIQIFHQRGYGLDVVLKLMCLELTSNELLSPRILDRSSSLSHEEIALTTAISDIFRLDDTPEHSYNIYLKF